VVVLTLFAGLIFGAFLVHIRPTYLIFGVAGLIFAYLLFFKIEIALIIFLLIHVELNRFNYLGNGTPFHPAGLMGISLIVGTICYFLFRLNGIDISRLRPSAAFVGFFLFCGLSLLRPGPHLMERVTVTLRLAGGLAIYLTLLHTLDSTNKIKWIMGAIIASQVWPTLNGLLNVAGNTGFSFDEETVRMGHSGLGVSEAMTLALCFAFLPNVETRAMRLLMGGLTVFFAAGLFFSFGRAGWIGFVIALIVISVLKHRKLLLILPMALFAVVVFVPGIRQRFSDISLERLDDRGSSTLAGRVEIWRAGLAIAKTSPVIGVGYGMGRYRVGEALSQYPWMIHNDYLSVLLDTGLAGLILFILWHGQWLKAIFRAYRRSTQPYDQAYALGVAALLISSLVMRFTDNLLLNSFRLYPICALVGATLALSRIRDKERNEVSVEARHDQSKEAL
jgi:O-antigen ligase